MERKDNASYWEENPNQSQGSGNEDLQTTKVSSFRIIASQFVAVFPIIFIKLRYGMGMGYTTVLIPELPNNNTGLGLTLDELTWFSSYCFVTPVGAISGGFIAQNLGVRQLLMLSYLLHISADLLFHWADNVAMILSAQAIVGFTGGITKGPSYTYISEILQPQYRSTTMAAMNLIVLLGRFFVTILRNFMHWRTQNFVFLVSSVIGFVFIHFIPDSPHWLASKNRLEDAQKSLARLRGWTTPEDVQAELHSSIMNAPVSMSLTENTPENDSRRETKFKQALSLYLDRSFYIPLLIMTAMFFFSSFNGTTGLSVFSGIIFDEIQSPISGHVMSSILFGLSIVSSLIYIFSIRFLGKRIITLASVFITAVGFIIAVTLLYRTRAKLITSVIYSWIISIALIISTFAYGTGLGKVIYFLNSELFPQKVRYVGAGVGYFIDEIIVAIFGKIFLYIVKGLTFPGALILFAVINIVSFIVIYFILPETEGITLQQIEERYAGTQRLGNKRSP